MDRLNFLCTILVWLSALDVIVNSIWFITCIVNTVKKYRNNNDIKCKRNMGFISFFQDYFLLLKQKNDVI